MPPRFIACGYGDRPDISEGMASLDLKYKAGHGFGYRPGTTTAAGAWPFRFRVWLADSGLLK